MAKEILIIRFSSLGDLILTTPFFRELKRLEPEAHVTLVTASSFAGIFAGNPHIDRLHALDRKQGKPALAALLQELKQTHWDLVFDLHRSLRSRLLVLKLRGCYRRLQCIDKRSFNRNLLLWFGINRFKTYPSQREAYLQPLREVYPHATLESHTELFPGAQEKAKIETILHQSNPNGKPLLAIGPGASFPGKCWPKEYFLTVAQLAASKGMLPVLLGGPGEAETEWISQEAGEKVLNLGGKLSYLETAALLGQAKLALSNDSAIVHFAEAMGTPALALFGPTVREFGYAPFLKGSVILERPLKCRPCSRNGKGECRNPNGRECLRQLLPEEVMAEVKRLLET